MSPKYLFAALALMVGFAPSLHAAGCDGATNCQVPGTSSLTAPTASNITGTQFNALSVRNSGTATANANGTQYWFYAYATSLGAPNLTSGSASFDQSDTTGNRVRAGFSLPELGIANANNLLTNGRITNLKTGTEYDIYVQACRGNAYNDPDPLDCSNWVQLPYSPLETKPLPVNPFVNPTAADVTTNSLDVRVDSQVSSVDPIGEQVTIDDQINAGVADAVIGPTTFANPFEVPFGTPPSGYNWIPNTKYRYTGVLFYPYSQQTAPETTQLFWTTPVNPSNVTVSNVTHCSADITARNTTGSIANPWYTDYLMCAGAICGAEKEVGTSGVPTQPTDTVTQTVSGLVPGTTYTPSARAMVGNDDGTQSGWTNSGTVTGTSFTTDGTSGAFTITNVTTNSADLNFPAGFDVSGAVSWQRRVGGVLTGPVVPGLPPATIDFTGLNPNTQYSVQVTVNETSCNYTVPPTAKTFTTTPNIPASFDLTASGARQLSATWTANSNPNATVYEIQYCTDAGFTTGCRTQTTAAGATSTTITTGVVPQTTYFAHVRALTVGGGSNSAYSNSDSATTPNETPTVNTASCTVPGGDPTQSTCNGTVTDNGPIGELRCSWSMQSGPGAVSFNPSTAQTATGSSYPANCPNVTATFPVDGSYVLTLTVTDQNGSGISSTRNVTVGVNEAPASIDPIVAPSGTNLVVGNSKTFNAVVRNQWGAVMSGQSVNWSLSNGAASRNPASGASTVVTGVNSTLSPVTLTASLPGLQSQNLQLTVAPSGAVFTQDPVVTLNPDNKTGSATTQGTDSSPGAEPMSYFWTLEAGPGPISVAPTDPLLGHNATITFSKAGTYRIRATIRDNFSEDSKLAPDVVVPQVLTSIRVCPVGHSCDPKIQLRTLQDQQFEATGIDQFGDVMALSNVEWTTVGGGNISSLGVFNSADIGENITVTAKSGNVSGAMLVSLVSFDVSGAYASPVPYKASSGVQNITFRGLGSQATIRIFTTSGREVFETQVNSPTYEWDIKNSSGESLASGVYFYRIDSPEGKKNGKLIIIK